MTTSELPSLFKGIALFTPGGDVVYCIDPGKQMRWHLHLCQVLQALLHLSEPPHFLVPSYTATLDIWQDPTTGQIHRTAEAAQSVLRYQPLLNMFFDTMGLEWRPLAIPDALRDQALLDTYRPQFPQLWNSHDLVLRCDLRDGADLSDSGAAHFPSSGLGGTLPDAALVRSPAVRPPTVKPLPGDRADGRGADSGLTAQTAPHPALQGYVLRLFVSGSNRGTLQALTKLHQLLDQLLDQPYTLKLVDVLQHPELAEQNQVSATPTLVKLWPLPLRKLVGTVESADQLLGLLETVDYLPPDDRSS
jgi:circadian clock protein KaiB